MIDKKTMMIPQPKGAPKMIGAIQWTLGPSVAAVPARPMTMRIPPHRAGGRRSSGAARPPFLLATLTYCGLTTRIETATEMMVPTSTPRNARPPTPVFQPRPSWKMIG